MLSIVSEALQDIHLYQDIFKLSAEGILLVNKEGTILMANPACKKFFVCDSEDLLNKKLENFIVEEYRAQFKNCFLNLDNNTSYINLDVFAIKKINLNLELKLE